MDKYVLDELTNELEQEEQKVEEQEREMEDSEQRLQKIEGAIQALNQDSTIKALLASNHQEAKVEHQAAQEKMEQSKATVCNIQEQIEAAFRDVAEEYDTFSELEAIGEDVSEAKEILEERQCLLEECHRRLEEIAQRLGISVDELDMETDDIIGDVSNTELAYLKENDFGAVTEKALDYEDTEYLSEGRLIPAWVKDCKDTPHDEVIPIGDVIARYGGDYGKYFSDIATDFIAIQKKYKAVDKGGKIEA